MNGMELILTILQNDFGRREEETAILEVLLAVGILRFFATQATKERVFPSLFFQGRTASLGGL